jgi:hypothetical protein
MATKVAGAIKWMSSPTPASPGCLIGLQRTQSHAQVCEIGLYNSCNVSAMMPYMHRLIEVLSVYRAHLPCFAARVP